MYEINLVPDVKNEMLKKQRLSNLILFIVIIVVAACVGLVLILGSIAGGQNIALSIQDTEIACRSDGKLSNGGTCDTSKYGTAVLKVANLNEFLTIQDQMGKISDINNNKMLLSRVFGVLDVLLPTGNEVVEISELTMDLQKATLNFDAQGNSADNIDYKALEVFTKGAELSYYDYGRYMRYDEESGSYVEIPTFCITEQWENGVLYGVYHKGQPGCETSILGNEEATSNGQEVTVSEGLVNGAEVTEEVKVEDIKIRRLYSNLEDLTKYKENNSDNGGGYYFDSACLSYGDSGNFDEAATSAQCPLLAETPIIRDSSNGRDSDDNLVLRFTANVTLSKDVFKFVNKHMRVVGPSRQNVTDSYTQIRDMFAEEAADCEAGDEQCNEGGTNG